MTAPATVGSVWVNHAGREWEVSYERGSMAGPDYLLTALVSCRTVPGGPWYERLQVYGCGDLVDPFGSAVEWVARLHAQGYRPDDGGDR